MDELVFGNDKLKIHFYGHSSLMLDFNGMRIYVDPVSEFARYETLPKADIVLVTHEHQDHLDPAAIEKIAHPGTEIVANGRCAETLKKATALANGGRTTVKGVRVEAVPAYNTTRDRDRFHPRGRDNGYVLTLGAARVYIAGDTEDIPEMKELKDIDVAFLPANQPYTMTVDQLLNAVKMIRPKICYPYHYGTTDAGLIEKTLKENTQADVRMRSMR